MSLKYILTLFALIIICFTSVTMQSGCANIMAPMGGPRDTLPPVLVNANPRDSTRSFTGKKVVLSFNEYVQLEDVQQNLIVSPVPKINPITDIKLKTITINIKDTLEPNTTYSFDFGNSLKDYNEGNVLRNFRYVFSTGSYLDSLRLTGKVLVAETGKIDTTLIVMLYKDLSDSAVVKEKPRYITRLDSTGSFRFENLAPGTFALYAIKDEGGARRYISKEQLFAFADSAITSQSQRNDIVLYAFEPVDTVKKAASTPVRSVSKKPKPAADKVLKITPNLSGDELDLLSNLELSVDPDLIASYDSTKAHLLTDSFKVVTGYSWKLDTSNKKINLVYPWPENTRFNLLLDSGFVADSAGRTILKQDTISFLTKRESEYGLVRLRFIGLQLQRHPVLQFIQNDQVKFSHVFRNNEFNAKLFAPGDYDLRLLYDENQNGVWDTGNFFGKHRQPEKVELIKRKINVKANWDNEVDIQL